MRMAEEIMMKCRVNRGAMAAAAAIGVAASVAIADGVHIDNLSLASVANGTVYSQNYAVDASGWEPPSALDAGVTRVASGFQGISSHSGSHHGYTNGYTSGDYWTSGNFTRFGAASSSARKTFDGGWTASQFVYLDTSWAIGSGFDYSVAMNNTNGNHLRDFIFHIGVNDAGLLRITADNNTYDSGNATLPANSYILTFGAGGAPAATISTTGWYEMRHNFYDSGGVLACNMQLLTAGGTQVYSTIRSASTDLIAGVGGVRYGWFNFGNVVNAAPIPGSGLAAIGTLGLAGVARRRRR